MTEEREGISQCFLTTLPGNVALIYVILIKHEGALSIRSVLTTTLWHHNYSDPS